MPKVLQVIGGASGGRQTLHAHAKPPAYVIVEFSIKDQDAYTKEYVPLIRKSIEGFGGIRPSNGLKFNLCCG